MPDAQTIWNIISIVVLALVGAALSSLRRSLEKLEKADEDLWTAHHNTVSHLQAYVLKDDERRDFDRLISKLDRIENKLDGKVDREDCPVIHSTMNQMK